MGILDWFRPGEHEQVERVLADMRALRVRDLRTGISWADWHTVEGQHWYGWLIPRLVDEVELLPCLLYTPPSLAVAPRTSAPPREPRSYADFVDQMITVFGRHFSWVELWNEPNNLSEWDWTLDPGWATFAEMVGSAAYWAHQRGKRVALGGMSPIDPGWLDLMGQYGVLEHVDAIGVHGFPGTWETGWDGWPSMVDRTRQVLRRYNTNAEIWITEVGYSTWRHNEYGQLTAFLDARAAPVSRVYWYSAYDLAPDQPTIDGLHMDEREYHFGLKRPDGSPKLLARLWSSGGAEAVRAVAELAAPVALTDRPVVITGGAGFVGTNLAHRLLEMERPVLLVDNLSRAGVEDNVRWLRRVHGERAAITPVDVRDQVALRQAVQGAEAVFHFAAQVAVTTSLIDPATDFEINARGTLNLLEALRACESPPPLLFTSTNKVYGSLPDIDLRLNGTRYEPLDDMVRAYGIGEDRPLDFHSAYACSKGAADQYVLDYARTFALPAVVFRMSCIYGPHQHGTEDQGWVAHFIIRALRGEPITLYGDGKQVRDVLYVDDLLDAMLRAWEAIDQLSGRAFNIGGGPRNVISLLDLIDMIEALNDERPLVRFADWRTGDQRYYVSDTRSFERATGWRQRVDVGEGVARLLAWLRTSIPRQHLERSR